MSLKKIKPGVYWLKFWNSDKNSLEDHLIYLLTDSTDGDYSLVWVGLPGLSDREDDYDEIPVVVEITPNSKWYFYLNEIHPIAISAIMENLHHSVKPIQITEEALIAFNVKFLELLKLNVSPLQEDPDGFVRLCAELETDFKDLERIRQANLKFIVEENEKYLDTLNTRLATIEQEINIILEQIEVEGHATKSLLEQLEVYNNELNKLELEMVKEGNLLEVRTAKLNESFYNKVDEIETKTKKKIEDKI